VLVIRKFPVANLVQQFKQDAAVALVEFVWMVPAPEHFAAQCRQHRHKAFVIPHVLLIFVQRQAFVVAPDACFKVLLVAVNVPTDVNIVWFASVEPDYAIVYRRIYVRNPALRVLSPSARA
jgi:hypothetical protein